MNTLHDVTCFLTFKGTKSVRVVEDNRRNGFRCAVCKVYMQLPRRQRASLGPGKESRVRDVTARLRRSADEIGSVIQWTDIYDIYWLTETMDRYCFSIGRLFVFACSRRMHGMPRRGVPLVFVSRAHTRASRALDTDTIVRGTEPRSQPGLFMRTDINNI